MAINPGFAAFFAVASFVSSSRNARSQQRVQQSQIELDLAASRAQAEELAYSQTKALRQGLATNLTLFAQGGRSDTALVNQASSAIGEYFSDQKKIELASQGSTATAQANRFASKGQQYLAENKAALASLSFADNVGLFKKDAWSNFSGGLK